MLERIEIRIETGATAREAADERKETRTSAVIFPLGPYHPLLSEPYALRLRLQGEQVVAATAPVTGYGHRGLFDLVADQPLEDALVVFERACAHAGQAYRLALCISVERAVRISAPRSAQLVRTFFAELEMTLSALWWLTELAHALNLRSLHTQGLEQRERLYDAATRATGQRVYWAVSRPGGVRGDVEFAAAREMLGWLRDAVEIWRVATAPRGALNRIAERVDARQVKALAESVEKSPAVAEASSDVRHTTPYDGYRSITVDWSPLDNAPRGSDEIAASALLLATRLKMSYDIMRACAEALGDAKIEQASALLKAGVGSVTVQTAHGPARVGVTLAPDQNVSQVSVITACAAALAQVPEKLVGRALADVPVALVGLNLCPSCADL